MLEETQILKAPSCRSEIKENKYPILENIIESAKISCGNYENGRDVIAACTEIRKHEENYCMYR